MTDLSRRKVLASAAGASASGLVLGVGSIGSVAADPSGKGIVREDDFVKQGYFLIPQKRDPARIQCDGRPRTLHKYEIKYKDDAEGNGAEGKIGTLYTRSANIRTGKGLKYNWTRGWERCSGDPTNIKSPFVESGPD